MHEVIKDMLDIDMEFKKGILIVRLRGILNHDTIPYLKKDFEKIIETNGIKYVLLNIKHLSFIDSTGLNAIKRCYSLVVKHGGKFIICGINKLFDYNYELSENLYQIAEETTAYEIVNI